MHKTLYNISRGSGPSPCPCLQAPTLFCYNSNHFIGFFILAQRAFYHGAFHCTFWLSLYMKREKDLIRLAVNFLNRTLKYIGIQQTVKHTVM